MFLMPKTKLRRKLLTYSFTHPDGDYYVRELAGLIDEDAGNLSRELRKLEEEGLYKSFSKGGAKFYSLNKVYPLYGEMKRIASKMHFKNRSCFTGALVSGDDILLGAVPMEDMDLIVSPAHKKLVVNPDSPNFPQALVK